jgi:hypothetical protein
MHIAWSDLNNVQEAGDYPFRDGRITISFADIAVWRNNPRATFRLMRKKPVQAEPHYVLGEQLEDRGAVGENIFYTSSNGDSWSLIEDPTTGAVAVRHVANPSGTNVVQIDIETFLSDARTVRSIKRFGIGWTRPATPRSSLPTIFIRLKAQHTIISSAQYNRLALGGITWKRCGSCGRTRSRTRYETS